MAKAKKGEGNRDADKRYRKAVQQTTEESTESERAEKARNLTEKEKKKALEAEERARNRARK